MTLCGIDCSTEDLTADSDGRLLHADDTPHRPVRYTADQLMAAQFPEPRWAVPGVIPEGLAMLVGGPKVGKSWLGLGLSVAVASGGIALSRQPVQAGDVLYLALEDPPRRLQSRLAKVLEGQPAPARLTLDTASGRGNAAIEHVRAWLADHADARRLVVIDVLAKVRPVNDGDDRYAADYRAGSAFKALADEYGVAILIVHHTRKARGDDFVDDISGTNGLAGAADTLCVLQRARTEADAILKITGRDVDEVEHPLKLTDGRWKMLEGPATDYTLPETGQAILRFLRENGGATPKALADELEFDPATVRQACRRMADQGHLSSNGRGTYTAVSLPSPVSPDHGSPGKTGVTNDQGPCHSVTPPAGPGEHESDSSDTGVTQNQDLFSQGTGGQVTAVTGVTRSAGAGLRGEHPGTGTTDQAETRTTPSDQGSSSSSGSSGPVEGAGSAHPGDSGDTGSDVNAVAPHEARDESVSSRPVCQACGDPLPDDFEPGDARLHFDHDCIRRYRQEETL